MSCINRITALVAAPLAALALVAGAACLVVPAAAHPTPTTTTNPPAVAGPAGPAGPVDPTELPAAGTYRVSVEAGPGGYRRTVTHSDGSRVVETSGLDNPNPWGPNRYYRPYAVVCDGTYGAYPPYVKTSQIAWGPDRNFDSFYTVGVAQPGCTNNPANQRMHVFLVDPANSGQFPWCTRMDAVANVNHFWITTPVVWFNFYPGGCRYSATVVGHWISYGMGWAFGLRGYVGGAGTSVMNLDMGTSVKYATERDQGYLIVHYPPEPATGPAWSAGSDDDREVRPMCGVCRSSRSSRLALRVAS